MRWIAAGALLVLVALTVGYGRRMVTRHDEDWYAFLSGFEGEDVVLGIGGAEGANGEYRGRLSMEGDGLRLTGKDDMRVLRTRVWWLTDPKTGTRYGKW